MVSPVSFPRDRRAALLGVRVLEPTRPALSVAKSGIVETGVHCESEGQPVPSNFRFFFSSLAVDTPSVAEPRM